jgi:hypothetical protein
VWELIFMLLILKIPMVWLGWVVWWAVKAEPEVAPGEGSAEAQWRPWKPAGPRRRRGGPHGAPTRAGRMRRRERAGA